MNSRHRNIQFISEEESKDKISFLDISITRSKINCHQISRTSFSLRFLFTPLIFAELNELYICALIKLIFSHRSKLWLKMCSKTLREICWKTGFLWTVFSHIRTGSYPYFHVVCFLTISFFFNKFLFLFSLNLQTQL